MPFKYSLFIFFLISSALAKAFNLRSDYSYEILGNVGEHIVLLRDRGLKYQLEVLGRDLSFKKTVELEFEKSKNDLIGVVNKDDLFTIYYSFRDKGESVVAARTYNEKVEPIDTTYLLKEKSNVFKQNFEMAVSEDKSKVLIYAKKGSDDFNIMTIDQDSIKLIYDDIITFKDFNLNRDFRTAVISNKAEVFILLNKNNEKGKKKKNLVEVNYVTPDSDIVETYQLRLTDILANDLKINYNNQSENFLISGLYHEKDKTSTSGYFFSKGDFKKYQRTLQLNLVTYNSEILQSIYGKKSDTDLQYFKIKDVIFRKDGGFLIVTEKNKVLARRSYYNGYNRLNNGSRQGLLKDYYNESIILFAIKPSGIEHWTEVLHKKQFSQDDNDIYGSFFAFKSPSRLRLLYNDEIKKDNTVSEYVVNPVGKFERNAVLSTDYQDLSLRFKDAIQISSTELLVPSQRTYNLNLVKIAY
jgi:hypothetical protein